MKKKVLLGLSGGVDSSISAYLLKEAGYEVVGVYMILHQKEGYHEENIKKVNILADFLGIETHILDLSKSFEKAVFQPFIDDYKAGITPNPCAVCNKNIKFGEMVAFADKLGIHHIATGHYVKTDGTFIYEASSSAKDQSYFLFAIDPAVIPRLIFPLATWEKDDVKALAAKFPTIAALASQKESSEICFVETTYIDILRNYAQVDAPGDVLDQQGKIVGKHQGYMKYTIGKRKGFTVEGAQLPHYVTKIVPEKNQIIVGVHEDLAVSSMRLKDVSMFQPQTSFTCGVKIRYRSTQVMCDVVVDGTQAHVTFHTPVYGLAVGQAAVFYDQDRLLGGGWII